MLEIILFYWVLPSLVVFLVIVNSIRFVEKQEILYDPQAEDYKFLFLLSIIWPLGFVGYLLLLLSILKDKTIIGCTKLIGKIPKSNIWKHLTKRITIDKPKPKI